MNSYYTLEPIDTNYSTNVKNDSIISNANIQSNWKYRQYIQKNANQIMKTNTMQYMNDSGNNPYTLLNTEQLDTTPYLFNSLHDNNAPIYKSPINSDLKQQYLEKERMKSRMVAPYIPTKW